MRQVMGVADAADRAPIPRRIPVPTPVAHRHAQAGAALVPRRLAPSPPPSPLPDYSYGLSPLTTSPSRSPSPAVSDTVARGPGADGPGPVVSDTFARGPDQADGGVTVQEQRQRQRTAQRSRQERLNRELTHNAPWQHPSRRGRGAHDPRGNEASRAATRRRMGLHPPDGHTPSYRLRRQRRTPPPVVAAAHVSSAEAESTSSSEESSSSLSEGPDPDPDMRGISPVQPGHAGRGIRYRMRLSLNGRQYQLGVTRTLAEARATMASAFADRDAYFRVSNMFEKFFLTVANMFCYGATDHRHGPALAIAPEHARCPTEDQGHLVPSLRDAFQPFQGSVKPAAASGGRSGITEEVVNSSIGETNITQVTNGSNVIKMYIIYFWRLAAGAVFFWLKTPLENGNSQQCLPKHAKAMYRPLRQQCGIWT